MKKKYIMDIVSSSQNDAGKEGSTVFIFFSFFFFFSLFSQTATALRPTVYYIPFPLPSSHCAP